MKGREGDAGVGGEGKRLDEDSEVGVRGVGKLCRRGESEKGGK